MVHFRVIHPSLELANLKPFQNYVRGDPSRVLYLKNMAPKKVSKEDIETLFARYVYDPTVYVNNVHLLRDSDLQIRLMNEGRMRGQAFVTLPSVEIAIKALTDLHGYILHEKPLCIVSQFIDNVDARYSSLEKETDKDFILTFQYPVAVPRIMHMIVNSTS